MATLSPAAEVHQKKREIIYDIDISEGFFELDAIKKLYASFV